MLECLLDILWIMVIIVMLIQMEEIFSYISLVHF
jgi:hypothetical protein